jgi:hypothetical protein
MSPTGAKLAGKMAVLFIGILSGWDDYSLPLGDWNNKWVSLREV